MSDIDKLMWEKEQADNRYRNLAALALNLIAAEDVFYKKGGRDVEMLIKIKRMKEDIKKFINPPATRQIAIDEWLAK